MKEGIESQYLKYKLEPESDVKPKEIRADDYIEHNFYNRKGSFEIMLGSTKLKLSSSRVGYFKKNKLRDALLDNFTKHYKDSLSNFALDYLRSLDEFSLENKDKKLDIKEIFSEGKIYFFLGLPLNKDSSFINGANEIFLTEDPLTPSGILTLFHEIGHYQDYKRSSEERARSGGALFSNSNIYPEGTSEETLRDERNAWAFALKNLRPFLKDLNINEELINQDVHNDALKSYSDSIRNRFKVK